MIFFASFHWFNNWFTSCGVVPLPVAIRRRRLPLMTSGCLRSCGVIEYTTASALFQNPSSKLSTFIWRLICPMPGSISTIWFIGPIFLMR